jgi:hypothetical protein
MVERHLDRLGEYLAATTDQPYRGWVAQPSENTSEIEGQR